MANLAVYLADWASTMKGCLAGRPIAQMMVSETDRLKLVEAAAILARDESPASLTSNEQLAAALARKLFALGSEGMTRQCQRIEFKGGSWNDKTEFGMGGLIESALARCFREWLNELRSVHETIAPLPVSAVCGECGVAGRAPEGSVVTLWCNRIECPGASSEKSTCKPSASTGETPPAPTSPVECPKCRTQLAFEGDECWSCKENANAPINS